MPSLISRRDFMATTASAVAMPYIVPSSVFGANKRFNVAVIGIGGRGKKLLQWVLKFREYGRVNVPAVCDIDPRRLEAAAKHVGPGCRTYIDYRALLACKDIDAVVIGTPDHWHACMTVHACETGKHVYVEKPASCTIGAGRAMVEAARKHNRVVQVGAQARSAIPAWQACTYIRNGMLGRVHTVRTWHGAGRSRASQYAPVPEWLDWDMWLGPMRWRRYEQGILGFRQLLDSGGGSIRDRGTHVKSVILWCLDADEQYPVHIETGAEAPAQGVLDAPRRIRVEYTFRNPDWKLIWEAPGEARGPGGFGMVFQGDEGELVVCRDGTEGAGNVKNPDRKAATFNVPADGVHVYRNDKHDGLITPKNHYDYYNMNHFEDWFLAIEKGTKPCLDIEIGHRATTINNLGNLSYILGRKLYWDGKHEKFIDDEYANRHLDSPQRHPYHL